MVDRVFLVPEDRWNACLACPRGHMGEFVARRDIVGANSILPGTTIPHPGALDKDENRPITIRERVPVVRSRLKEAKIEAETVFSKLVDNRHHEWS